MKQGQAVEKFKAEDKEGKTIEVLFRYPRMRDVKAAMKTINSSRAESEFLGKTGPETMKSEKKFFEENFENMRKKKGLFLLVEIDGALAGSALIRPYKYDASNHIGKFGISLREKFTESGIGTRLTKKMLQLAKTKTRFKIIDSGFFSKNKRSWALHKKFGFRQWGRFPKGVRLKNGRYDDYIQVYKQIKKL